MRKYAILALLLVAFPTPASETVTLAEAEFKRDFNLEENSRRATHILVVDVCGKILDVWKGTAQVGDYISLDTVLNPNFHKLNDTRQSRFNWLNDPHHFTHDMLGRRSRMILFLVQAPRPNPVDLQDYESDEIENGYRHFYASFPRSERSAFGVSVVDRVTGLFGVDRESSGFNVGERHCPIPRTPLRWSACSMFPVDDFGCVLTRTLGMFPLTRRGNRHKDFPGWRVIDTEHDVRRKVWDANNQTRSLD